MLDNIKVDIKRMLWTRDLHGIITELSPLSGMCEHGNELEN
jgi:hypothetical protein